MTSTIKKEIEIELTNREIGELIHSRGQVTEMADILDFFVINIVSIEYVSGHIARQLDLTSRDFFKGLAKDIKIKEAEEEEEGFKDVPAIDEPTEFEEVLEDALIKTRGSDKKEILEILEADQKPVEAVAEPEKEEKSKLSQNYLDFALYEAIASYGLDEVKEAVKNGANINYRGYKNYISFPAAVTAVLQEKYDILQYLVDNGVDLTLPDYINETVIQAARRKDDKKALEIMGVSEPEEEEESTETFYKVGDRFVFNTDSDLYTNGSTFEIISFASLENSVALRKIVGVFQHWLNKDYQRETTVTDKNKITEAEWNIITNDMASSFTKIEAEPVQVEEPKEEPATVENEVFYHIGQKFKKDPTHNPYVLATFGDFKPSYPDKWYVWLICPNSKTAWFPAQPVNDREKITEEEFSNIADDGEFTLIEDE